MSNARFIHDGKSIDHTPSTDVASGDVVVQNALVGIAKLDIPANTLGALAVTGVFDLPKPAGSGVDFGVGESVWWDETNQVAAIDNGGGANALVGKCVRLALDPEATVRVRLTQ